MTERGGASYRDAPFLFIPQALGELASGCCKAVIGEVLLIFAANGAGWSGANPAGRQIYFPLLCALYSVLGPRLNSAGDYGTLLRSFLNKGI